MQIKSSYDVVVIGSGPGGEGAAMQAIKQGMTAAIIEENSKVGGNCTHVGTIPSKALRHEAYRLTTVKNHPLYQSFSDQLKIGYVEFLKRAHEVVNEQVERRQSHYNRNHVPVLHGRARIEGKNIVVVKTSGSDPDVHLQAKYIVIATGSRPFRPPGIDFSHPRVLDSDTVLNLNKNPRSISIYGAGVIGCEYTSIFKALGTKVNLINTRASLLSFLDDEISAALSYHLRDQGVIIRHNESVTGVTPKDDEVIIHLASGKNLKSDVVLFTTGRTGNSDGMGLEALGIEIDSRGNVVVNEHYQTSVPNIYAVGDISGFPALASAAYDQGRFASRHMIDPDCDDRLVKDIPVGIYTSPEISCLGRTEAELTAEKIPYEVGHVSFRHLARAQITGQPVGMLKMLFHTKTLEILGIHCFGQNAAEIIHIGQAIMAQKGEANSIKYFINVTFNYPTMAEAYRVAALNGFNRL